MSNFPLGIKTQQTIKYLPLLDKISSDNTSTNIVISKTLKNIRTIKAPVIRYFETYDQSSSYYCNGEYDLVPIFKLLKQEAFFSRAVEKKVALGTKSGFSIVSPNDEITDYFNKRFLVMQLQTGKTQREIIRNLLFYLFACNNAFLVKVRDPEFEFAKSYTIDEKEMHPVVGYFTVHPTTMKPRFKYKKESGIVKLVLDKWIQTNLTGAIKEFSVEDVVHFTLNKEDGFLFAAPSILPVIDDIRSLRKLEEDISLLVYRDLFPIIHYTVENPVVTDHATQQTELDRARIDMQNILQDGGIATDFRHKIQFIGNENKGIDVNPFLKYFRERVFSGLGVSPMDLSISGESNLGDSDNVSKQLVDSVKYVQQELSDQFKSMILTELALQSPFNDILSEDNMPILSFEEVDLEWKIRQENHNADLFTKNVKTIHEVRDTHGDKTISDEDLMYTHGALFGAQPPNKTMLDTRYGDQYAELQKKIDPPKPATGSTPSKSKSKGSAAKRDSIKSSKTNSNIVKKKAYDSLQDSISIKDQFIQAVTKLQDEEKATKINISFLTKHIYDSIKLSIVDSFKEGLQDGADQLGLEDYSTKIEDNIFSHLDELRDDISSKLYKDPSYLSKAANRIAITDRTEKSRAYNYGIYSIAKAEGKDKLIVVSEADLISEDSTEYLGKEIDLTKENYKALPPFRPNQTSLKLKIV